MSLQRFAFAYEICKIAEASDKKRGYGAALAATAPAAALQAGAEYPKGWLDRKVENAIVKQVASAEKVAPWRTGVGRAIGRLGPGVLTAPVFFSGISDVKKGDKKKGYGKIIGASGAYAAGKGISEALVEGGGKAEVLRKMKAVGGTRGLLGVGGGILTAAALAETQGKRKKDNLVNRVAVPTAVGAGIGAGKGIVEGLALGGKKVTARELAGKASGRAASGVLGALVISEIARHLEKKSEAQPAWAIPQPSDLYDQTRKAAKDKPTEVLQTFLKGQQVQTGGSEFTPTRRAITYAVNDELRDRGIEIPAERMRDQVHGKEPNRPTPMDVVAASVVISAPELVWTYGIQDMTVHEKDLVLRDAIDKMIAVRGIERVHDPDAMYIETKGLTARAENQIELGHSLGRRQFITAPEKAHPADLAHELGHATAGAMRKRTIGSKEARTLYEISRIPAIALPLMVVGSTMDRSFHTDQELEAKAKMSEGIGRLATLLAMPTLAEEAAASYQGLKFMRAAGASKSQLLRAGARLGPAFLTYAAPFASGAIGAKILRSKKRGEASVS